MTAVLAPQFGTKSAKPNQALVVPHDICEKIFARLLRLLFAISSFSLLVLFISFLPKTAIAASNCEKNSTEFRNWPAWETFKKNFINEGGRVIDASTPRFHSSSEGQAYGLFFALVANDKKSFDFLLRWTEANLAGGDLTARLPAWYWGKKDDGSWGVIDQNSASDADLWLAYTLGQAGTLWNDKRYTALSTLIGKRILREETADLPKLGLSLLPAPSGFTPTTSSWKLNPSYTPIQVMRWFANNGQDERWEKLLHSSAQIIIGASPKGYSPDWILYDSAKGYVIDSQGQEKGNGGYNAIRVYLWAGMLPEKEPYKKALLTALKPMASLVENKAFPPEFINVSTGEINKPGSTGFSAAMLPFLKTIGYKKAWEEQNLRISALLIKPDAYYDQVLAMYALGWQEQRYQFHANGNLMPQWKSSCGK